MEKREAGLCWCPNGGGDFINQKLSYWFCRPIVVGPIIALSFLLCPSPVIGQLLREPQTPYHFLRYDDVPGDQREPRVAKGFLGTDQIGGPGGTLETFYPLFPKFAYFTEASINAPMNFIDVFPSVTVQPWRTFAVKIGIDVLWRYSVQDAFYQPPGLPSCLALRTRSVFLAHSLSSSSNGKQPHISPSTPSTSTF